MRERDSYAKLPRGRWKEAVADKVSICSLVSITAARSDPSSLVTCQVDLLDVKVGSNIPEQLRSGLPISVK